MDNHRNDQDGLLDVHKAGGMSMALDRKAKVFHMEQVGYRSFAASTRQLSEYGL